MTIVAINLTKDNTARRHPHTFCCPFHPPSSTSKTEPSDLQIDEELRSSCGQTHGGGFRARPTRFHYSCFPLPTGLMARSVTPEHGPCQPLCLCHFPRSGTESTWTKEKEGKVDCASCGPQLLGRFYSVSRSHPAGLFFISWTLS